MEPHYTLSYLIAWLLFGKSTPIVTSDKCKNPLTQRGGEKGRAKAAGRPHSWSLAHAQEGCNEYMDE